MKYNPILLSAIAVSALALSCAKEAETPIENTEVVPETKVVTLHATTPETKVSIDNEAAFSFQVGDVISVIDEDGFPVAFTTSEAGTSVDFSGSPLGELGAYAMYPESNNHLYDDGTHNITFNLPEIIEWKADASLMPMLGTIAGSIATFRPAGGTLKLVCYNIPDGSYTFRFTATNKKISGDYTLADASANLVTAAKTGSDNVLAIMSLDEYPTNAVFYVPLPTGSIDGFKVEFLDSSDEVLFASKIVEKTLSVTAGKIIIGPALNCSTPTVLWSEDFSGYSNNDVPSGDEGEGYGSVKVAYSVTNGNGTTKIYASDNLAGGTAPELLVAKGSGTFKASGIPTNGAAAMTLVFKSNNTLNITATSGITVGSVDTGAGEKTVSLTNAGSLDAFDLTFTNPTGNSGANARLDDIVLSVPGVAASVPTISTGADELTIAVGSTTANTSASLSGGIDGLEMVAVVEESAKSWLSASLSAGTLTVTAAGANETASDRVGTVTLKATGANKVITVTQPTARVANPEVAVVPGDATFTATWSAVPHATSYLAYLRTDMGTPDAGTNITSSITESAGVYTLTYSVTNDVTYYLYVKTNGVDANYVAPDGYVWQSFTPEEAKGTAENPYDASELYDIVAAYAGGSGPAGTIYVKGYVYNASDPTSNYQTYYISDDGTSTKAFEVYRGKGISGANITDANRVNDGDWVVVSGTAVNYSGTTPEFSAGSQIVTHNPKLSVSFSPAEGTYYSTQSVTLSSTPSGATIYYTTDGSTPTTSSSVYSSAISVSATTTIKALAVKSGCLDSDVASATFTISAGGPDYTTLETSNVTLTAGTNGSSATVNGQTAIKVGTSSKGGDMSVTVPTGTTKLHLHAAAWNSVTNLSLNITGATVSPASIDLSTGGSAISGSSTDYTLASPEDFYFQITLSGITEPTEITFTTSVAKRFVIWGVNAE